MSTNQSTFIRLKDFKRAYKTFLYYCLLSQALNKTNLDNQLHEKLFSKQKHLYSRNGKKYTKIRQNCKSKKTLPKQEMEKKDSIFLESPWTTGTRIKPFF